MKIKTQIYSIPLPLKILFGVVFLLLFFGVWFSKLYVLGPLIAHDLLLLLAFVLSILFNKTVIVRFKPILIVSIIAFFYLVYSIFFIEEALLLKLRQFNLFVYMFVVYGIFCLNVNQDRFVKVVALLKWVGIVSVVTQVIYLIVGILFLSDFTLFGTSNYVYFSPLVIMGIIVFAAYALAKNSWPLYLLAIVTSVFLGHSSAFLAVIGVLGIGLLIKIKTQQRLAVVVLLVAFVFMAKLLSAEFNDNNAKWRLFFWQHIVDRSFDNHHFGVFGHGFGNPYMTLEYAQFIADTIQSKHMLGRSKPLIRWTTGPHNSFLSIMFHVGFFPFLIFLSSFVPVVKKMFTAPIRLFSFEDRFLILSLVGLSIWCSFNVVLELPHSSILFWIVVFATLFQLSNAKKEK